MNMKFRILKIHHHIFFLKISAPDFFFAKRKNIKDRWGHGKHDDDQPQEISRAPSRAGRNYLKCYSAGYFEEQKGILGVDEFFGEGLFRSDMLGV